MADTDAALAAGWRAAVQAVADSRAAPLSARHALHAAVALDRLSDLAHARRAALPSPLARAGDILSFRAALRAADPAFGPLMDLTACSANGPHLALIATQIPPEGFASLPVGDLMVSLYNAGTVPRLYLVTPAESLPMQPLLQAALDWWRVVVPHAAAG
ncbi:hypothetical protein [Pararhodobacter zhoushanensis]|uniref:Uncharacterized protein n=1 Tax=Pararhodobacter zhoushanensis TaxID=2479545 RepID=A0ABT3GW01_9RHOB|nr:hypothetical protein [Pararhodobacter zhoushanensis]MCW1931703.1 hypothetical protein [Pararhodobacter zhoushanensis]